MVFIRILQSCLCDYTWSSGSVQGSRLSLNPPSLSPGGSESSWDKEKLQSPSSGAQHGLAHIGLSAQHGLSGSHLSSLQQSHLLANRESFIHHIHSFTPAPAALILLGPIELHVVFVIVLWFSGLFFWFAHVKNKGDGVFMTIKSFSCFLIPRFLFLHHVKVMYFEGNIELDSIRQNLIEL